MTNPADLRECAGQMKGAAMKDDGAVDHAAEVARLEARVQTLTAALTRLRDCDWVVTPIDRMDAVRDIARQALADAGEEVSQ